MGNFNQLDICWRNSTEGHVKSWRFLESTEDSFLTQMIEEAMRIGVPLALIITNKEGLFEDVKVEGSLGCSNHKMVEFRVPRRGTRAKSKITTLNIRRADFGLFRYQLVDSHGIRPWMEEGPKKAVWYLRITFSKLKSSPLQ